VTSADLRHFEAAPAGDVDAIEGYCLAFRRDDFAARGPNGCDVAADEVDRLAAGKLLPWQ